MFPDLFSSSSSSSDSTSNIDSSSSSSDSTSNINSSSSSSDSTSFSETEFAFLLRRRLFSSSFSCSSIIRRCSFDQFFRSVEALTSTAVKKGGLSIGDVAAVYKYKNTLIDVKLDTASIILKLVKL